MAQLSKFAFALPFGIFFLFHGHAHALNSELHAKVDTTLIQSALNTVVASLSNQNGEISRTLENFSQEIPFNLNDLNLDSDLVTLARDLGKVDLNGMGKLNVLLESPQIKGEVSFGTPSLIKRQDGKFDAEVSVYIRNYHLTFEHVWFTSSGVMELEPISENSCHSLITSNAKLNDEFLLNATQSRESLSQYLNHFYAKLNQQSFKGHYGKLWARIDHLGVGWVGQHQYSDNRNRYIAKLKLLIDPSKNGTGIALVSFSHNLGKKKGSWLPVSVPAAGVVVPPMFIRTQSRKIVNDVISGEEIPRCTYVENNPIKKLIAQIARTAAKDLLRQMSSKSVGMIIEKTKSVLAQLDIPAVPDALIYTNVDRKRQEDANSMVYRKDITFDFNKDLHGIVKNFTTYRAALGLDQIASNADGSVLEAGFNSDLTIDGFKLFYKEDYTSAQPSLPKEFKWSNPFGTNAAVAVNGSLLNKIVNPIKDHLLNTRVSAGFKVDMNDNLFDVDPAGKIVIKPHVEISYEGIDLISLSFEVNAKPEIVHGQDGRSWLKLRMNVPSASSIVASINPSRTLSAAEIASYVLLGITFTTLVKAEIKERIQAEVQSYIDEIHKNTKDIELTSYIKEYGIVPHSIQLHKLQKSTYLEIPIKVKKFPGLVEAAGGIL